MPYRQQRQQGNELAGDDEPSYRPTRWPTSGSAAPFTDFLTTHRVTTPVARPVILALRTPVRPRVWSLLIRTPLVVQEHGFRARMGDRRFMTMTSPWPPFAFLRSLGWPACRKVALNGTFLRETLRRLLAAPAAIEGVDPLQRTPKGSLVPADEAGQAGGDELWGRPTSTASVPPWRAEVRAPTEER